LAKYVERLLAPSKLAGSKDPANATLTSGWLAEQGWAS
jgi:hypothetical protein